MQVTTDKRAGWLLVPLMLACIVLVHTLHPRPHHIWRVAVSLDRRAATSTKKKAFKQTSMANPQLVFGGPSVVVPLNDGANTNLVTPGNFSVLTSDPNQRNGPPSAVPGFSNISLASLPVTVNGLTVLSAPPSANGQYDTVTIQASAQCTLPPQASLYFATQSAGQGIPNAGPFDVAGGSAALAYFYTGGSTLSGPQPVSGFASPAPNLYDKAVGDTTTFHVAAQTNDPGNTGGYQFQALIDLGPNPPSVSGYEVVPYNVSSPCSIAVYSSDNGSVWTDMTPSGASSSVGQAISTTFSATTHRYWQGLINYGGPYPGTLGMSDFRLYDAGGTPIGGPGGGPAAPASAPARRPPLIF